ncbi:MAG: response regulator [Bacteriovoracaceae bacterium]|nr:response regulator [Bacteriovoracaceae bacterium]
MAQVILIEDNETLHNLLSVNLTSLLNVELIPRDNATEAIGLLKILPKIDLIITRVSVGDEDTALQISQYILENGLDIPMIALGDAPEKVKEVSVVFEEFKSWRKIVESAAKLLGISKESLERQIQPDYSPVSIKYFLSVDTICCEVFIRIKKGPDNYQFVKRFHSTDKFSRPIIEKYITQGLDYFYIPHNEKERFATFISNALVMKLDKAMSHAKTEEEQIEAMAEGYDVVTRQILEIGFTPSTIQLTESVIDAIQTNYSNAKEVSPLLYKVINSKSSYMYQISHVTSMIAAECLKEILGDGTPKLKESQKILTYAAFFNDINLVENDELCKIASYEALESEEMEEKEWDQVFNHALESSIFIEDYPESSPTLQQVIREHHGSINGKGFPTSPDSRMCELSKVFIVAETFAREMFRYKESGNKEPRPIISYLYEAFSTPDMIAIVTALESTLKKNKGK